LHIDEFAPRLSFFFDAHNDLFEEVAKFRAARRMWARFMKEKYNANDRSCWLRFHTQTAGCSLTAQQPHNNIIRVTIQALAGVLGGTQSLHTNSMDETHALPTEESVTIAVRTQQILAHESGVANTVDPLAGSYFVEKLTCELEEEALEYIRKIEEIGGMVPAIEKGYPQREIQEAAYRYQKQVESGDKFIVGINKYADDEPVPIDILRIDQAVEDEQVERLRKLRESRDSDMANRSLENLQKAANGNENLMPFILDCVRAYVTLGEICGALKEIFGEFVEPKII
jgi:methylmalonyl-CoA mutase N-terminal domain/subunit